MEQSLLMMIYDIEENILQTPAPPKNCLILSEVYNGSLLFLHEALLN